jgi:AcrR family transcriptional regulator
MSGATPVSRRTRPAKAALSRAAVVYAALRILDRDGLGALTMRRVAQELETGAASLYVYVSSRDELMAAMLDEALAQIGFPTEGTWRERLHALATATIEAMARHEGLALVALGRIPTGANELLVLDRMLALLKEGGLDDATSGWAIDLIYQHIAAAAAEQNAYQAMEADGAEHVAAAGRRYAALPPERYRMITSLRESLLAPGDREGWGLNVLLNGLLHTPVGG